MSRDKKGRELLAAFEIASHEKLDDFEEWRAIVRHLDRLTAERDRYRDALEVTLKSLCELEEYYLNSKGPPSVGAIGAWIRALKAIEGARRALSQEDTALHGKARQGTARHGGDDR